MSERTRAALIVGGLLMGALFLAPLLSGTLRETLIVPLLYVAWTLWLALSRLPQVLFWAIFLAAAGLVAWRSLTADPLFLPATRQVRRTNPGRVAILSRWVRDLTQGTYFQRRMARHMVDLTLEAKGYPERPTRAEDLIGIVERGDLRLPPEVIDYVQQGTTHLNGPTTQGRAKRWLTPLRWLENWLALRTFTTPDTRQLEQLISHLEDELELSHDADR